MPTKIVMENISQYPDEVFLTVNNNETLHYVIYGYAQTEKRVTVTLGGEGGEAILTGVLIGRGGACTLHTVQRHAAAHTTSDLFVKTVLCGDAIFKYHGEIRIEKNAQQSNAYQRNENILSSNRARVETKPELEILANDVRCTHGATVGKLDREVLFYLRSRGLDARAAEALALAGFLRSAIQRIPDENAQKILEHYILQERTEI